MRPIRGFRWWIAGLLFGASALSFFDRQVLSVLSPEILTDLGMSNIDYSHAVSAFTIAYSVMFTLGGRLMDRLGTRRGLGLAVAFWTVASLLHAGVRSSLQLTGARFMLGIGEGGCFPGAAKGIFEWFPAGQRALAMGIATTGGSAIGAVVAPPLIVWISANATWRGAFLITGAVGAIWVVAWFLLFRDPTQSKLVSEEERADILAGRGESATEPPWAWKRLLSLRQVWALLAMRFLFDPVFYFYMFWIPQYLSQERGASIEDIGRLTWIPFLVLGISSVIGGAVSDRLVQRGYSIDRARKMTMGAAALFTPISVLALIAPDALWAVVLLSGLMFAHGFWMTNYMTLFGDLFPAGSVATVVGLSGTAGGIGGALSGLLIGWIVESFSFTPPILACGIVYPLAMVIMLLAIPRIERIR